MTDNQILILYCKDEVVKLIGFMATTIPEDSWHALVENEYDKLIPSMYNRIYRKYNHTPDWKVRNGC